MRIPAFLVVAAAAISGPVLGQCSTFANTPPGTDLQLDDDDLRTVGLGFTFSFAGQSYDTITICSNGFIWLGTVGIDDFDGLATDFFANEPDMLALGPRIAACWDDWDTTFGGNVYFRTDGASASVVWKNIPHFLPVAGTLNAELVLASNGEFYVALDGAAAVPASTCIVGSAAGGGAAANPIDWSTALPLLVPGGTGYEKFTLGSFDLAGQTIRCVPSGVADYQAQAGSLTTCTPGTYPPLASDVTSFGTGCPALSLTNPSAIYELFTPTSGPNPTDMSGLSIKFVRTGTTYSTVAGPGFDTSYTTQGTVVPQFDETIARNLSVGPMGEFPLGAAGFISVDAAANGYLLLQPNALSDFSPTAVEFLAEQVRIAPHWTDYDLTFAGTFYWSNNDPNFCMATWENVEMYGQYLTSNTFQVKLMANGDIIFSYGSVASDFDDVLVGITLGNGAPDPGSSDLSAAITTPVVRDLGSMVLPLTHTTSGRAAIHTAFTLQANNLNGGVLGAFVIGGTPLNVDLTPFGAPGCSTYCSLDSLYIVTIGAGGLTLTFQVPPSPILYGSTAHTQAAVLVPLNSLGIISSNRLTFTVGL